MSMTVTLPNEEWAGRMGWVLGTDGFLNSRTGLSIQFWSAPDVVYGHPCQWAGTEIDVEPTVDSVADALAGQAVRDATTPREITVGDYRGVELQLTVPDDIDFATCDDATFWSWVYGPSDGRFQQGPAQHDLIRIVDVDGVLVLVDATYWPELPADTHVEMLDVLASMAFEPTDVADKPS